MEFDYPEKGIPIEKVRSVDSIVKRFQKTGAMSYEIYFWRSRMRLAIAMNKWVVKSKQWWRWRKT